MCTSIVSNRKKTIVGWNLDLLDMEYRINSNLKGVFIEINDSEEGWLPLFGANSRGDFVGMPTCWPFDERSNPRVDSINVIHLDIDLLLQKKTLDEIHSIASSKPICSVPGLTFMGALSDRKGNVLHIIPGQGALYFEKPKYKILTNFSPYKMDRERHPWMGWDRYHIAESMLEKSDGDFDIDDCFSVLKAVAQEVCPTVVSMVYDADANSVYWCQDRKWNRIESRRFL